MADSGAMIGYHSRIEFETAAGTDAFVDLAEVTDITPPADSVDVVDVTHGASPDSTREAIPGLTDPGEISLEMNFIPGANGDAYIRAWRAARDRRKVRITFPNDIIWTFTAFVTGYTPATPNEDKLTATLTCKVSGSAITSNAGDGSLDFGINGNPLLTLI
jgi:hypothetical protein